MNMKAYTQAQMDEETALSLATVDAAKAGLKLAQEALVAAEEAAQIVEGRRNIFDLVTAVVQRAYFPHQRVALVGDVLVLTIDRVPGENPWLPFKYRSILHRGLKDGLPGLRACLALRGCTKLLVRMPHHPEWNIVRIDELPTITKTKVRQFEDRYGAMQERVDTYEEEPRWDSSSQTYPHISGLLEWEIYTPAPEDP